ncbi:MAG: hypothetical protein IH851_06640 [Armatimonadetes bacterium]|nr:hypothetical protein [Armatimonadota bacterium]
MNPQELREKLERGEKLSPMEWAMLDSYLESGRPPEAVEAVGRLRRDEPSLVWRSRLNDRLAAEAGKSRSPLRRLNVRALIGPAVAAAAAGLMIFAALNRAGGGAAAPDAEVAELLIQWHEEVVASSILPGDGTDLAGFVTNTPPFEPDELDDLLYGEWVKEL